ncbi:response regulator [Caballeronia sordidicola]|nr:response regulator [Caballeronia sordidicola]
MDNKAHINDSFLARTWTNRNVGVHQPLRVLVVDDNQDAAEALVAYLFAEQLVARAVFGGRDAISEAIAWQPHIVIMDISMPECNGYEAARALRQHALTAHIGIVAFTALDESEVRRHLIDHEFDGYCQKGQNPSNVNALIFELTGAAAA